MRYCIRWLKNQVLVNCLSIAALTVFAAASAWGGSLAGAGALKADIFVPYEDIAELVDPADKAVLLDRERFEKLLAAAEANARQIDTLELGQVKHAEYSGRVSGDELTLKGKLQVVSMSGNLVAIGLGFGGIGLSKVVLDGQPAPLGYDKKGKLTLILTSKGLHELEIEGTARLKELATGGMQFSITLPEAVSANMDLSAPGDLDMHATAPATETSYDKQTDRTSIGLTVGGQGNLAVVLLGNGRQEDDRPILLGESASTVTLTASDQLLECLYTVQVLRRGVRQLQFRLPREWTVTEMTSPGLVVWSVDRPTDPQAPQMLTVRLRSAATGTMALRINATAARTGRTWRGPRIGLVDAAFERGLLVVNTDEGLGVRGEKTARARREDLSARPAAGLAAAPGGLLYFHWGDNWSVELELETLALRRSIKGRQALVVSQEEVTLSGDFEVTAVDRELFDMSFAFSDSARQWQITRVQVDGKDSGFEYRQEDSADRRLLKIELHRPVLPEKLAKVGIVLRHVPAGWSWPSDAPERNILVPVIESGGDTVSGHFSVSAVGDLDALPTGAPVELEAVGVGRMVSLGIRQDVQHAYSYNKVPKGTMQLRVSRRRPRQSADSVGLVTVRPGEFSADWRIAYAVSRASTKRLYLLADKSIGQEIRITSPSVPISSKRIVASSDGSLPPAERLAEGYDLWQLNLDRPVLGEVPLGVRYERALPGGSFDIPLVRPVCEGQISEQLAIQAGEELALDVEAAGAKEIDAIDLPPLPAAAGRILAAFRLDAATSPTGPETKVTLETAVHKNYEIPSALASSAVLTTYLDVKGGQRTEADFTVANAGQQFLTIRLPEGAELWSLRVDNKQAKPQKSPLGDYQVALGPLGRPVPVKVVYAWRPDKADLGRLSVGGVELPGVEMNQIAWNVVPPPGYVITSQQTRMETGDLVRPVPAYVQFRRFLQDNIFAGSLLLRSAGKTRPLSKARFDGGSAARPAAAAIERGEARPADSPELSQPVAGPEPAAPNKPAEPKKKPLPEYLGAKLAARGRYTLAVELAPTPGAGPRARFTGLGGANLVVGLTSRLSMSGWYVVGFLLVAVFGIKLVRGGARKKAVLFVTVLSLASLLAIWRPGATHFANGAFAAGLCLVPFYLLLFVLCWLWRKVGTLVRPGPAKAAALVVLLLCLGYSTGTAEAATTGANPASQKPAPPADVLIIPYDGDPTTAETSQKILVPYARFVRLWNLAHPEDTIDGPRAGTDVSLADVRYDVKVEGERLDLLLTAEVRTYGRDWVVLAMPLSGLAVTESTFDGQPAQLQVGSKGMVMMLPGDASGRLQLRAVGTPTYLGRRGTARFSLPPLPGAVMEVVLPDDDLELEVDGIEGALARREIDGRVRWTVGLGMTRRLTLRWLPKAGGGVADRTLSAVSTHDVYAFHWAIVGVTKVNYSFSGGEHDRFALLLPADATLTDLKGANLRDYRQVGEKTVEGRSFKVVEVRLHRPATKQYEITARWLAGLPALGKPARLLLLRADDVSRESGTVTLHSAGGMDIKALRVSGGRRTDIRTQKRSGQTGPAADRARPVARFYWPYRPFQLSFELSRLTVSPRVRLDQLVRISPDRVELLVQADLKTEQGKLFGASFSLPAGYELLSTVGPAVESFYERSGSGGSFLHVKFRSGQQQTRITLVLVCRDVELADFSVPAVMYIDSDTQPAPDQEGRLAVQVASSLEASTAASENLRSIAPRTLRDWLDAKQAGSVRFAYRYESGDISLRLGIKRKTTRISAEVFAGVVIRTTAASYTYRLRYEVTGSPVDRLSFSLPEQYASLVAVDSPAMRSVAQSDAAGGRTQWTVALVNEVTGLVDVAVNFALPLEGSTKTIPVPRLETDAPAGYSTIVAVQNFSRHEITVEDPNVEVLGPSEQQRLISRAMREALQYVFRFGKADWSLDLGFVAAKPAERIQIVVDLLSLTTVTDRSGRCRYEAKVALQNRSEQFLHIDVPKGLRLWSASVAGEPVKPVAAADSPEGRVLVPLVKTSPGGLPYEVYMYFADDGDKPLIRPLNGMTHLKPPPISIVGVPVVRTTWSLRLPSGYRYIWPGGNMSPVAGTVEMLTLGIEAKLEQLKRLEKSYRVVAGSRSQKEQVIASNWGLFNKKLTEEISNVDSYLDANRDQVSEDEYRRLKSTLGGQVRIQNATISGNAAFVQKQQEQLSNDLNFFINGSISNPGIAEVTRDNALLVKPVFIADNEARQIEVLNRELQLSEQFQKEAERIAQGGKGGGKKPADVTFQQRLAGDLIVGGADEKADLLKKMSDISRQSAKQLEQKRRQIQEQLDALGDNRLERHYQEVGKQVALGMQSVDRDAAVEVARELADRIDTRKTPGSTWGGAGGQVGGYAGGGQGGYGGAVRRGDVGGGLYGPQTVQPQGGRYVAGLGEAEAASRPVGEGTAPATGFAANGQPVAEGQAPAAYVAGGTYSLPVALPAGEIRLDFARSSGDARISIWAVPVGMLRSIYGALAVIAVMIVAFAIIRFWPRPDTRRPISLKWVIIYILLVVIPALAFGLFGFLVGVAAALGAEFLCRRFVRRPLGETAA